MRRNLTVVVLLVLIFVATGVMVASQASAVTIDSFSVTFNNLPTAINTSGLIPSSVGVGYPGYYYGMGSSNSGIFWGQTNPFAYNTALYNQDPNPPGGGVRSYPGTPTYDAIW